MRGANGEFNHFKPAGYFAQRIVSEGGDSFEQRIDFAYQQALNRAPDAEEKAIFQQLFEDTRAQYDQAEKEALQLSTSGLSPAAKDIQPVELASWTAIARGLFNLYEFTYRN